MGRGKKRSETYNCMPSPFCSTRVRVRCWHIWQSTHWGFSERRFSGVTVSPPPVVAILGWPTGCMAIGGWCWLDWPGLCAEGGHGRSPCQLFPWENLSRGDMGMVRGWDARLKAGLTGERPAWAARDCRRECRPGERPVPEQQPLSPLRRL